MRITTVRMPDELHARLKRVSSSGISMNQIQIEAISKHVKSLELLNDKRHLERAARLKELVKPYRGQQ